MTGTFFVQQLSNSFCITLIKGPTIALADSILLVLMIAATFELFLVSSES
jgi:hypothetical protein